MFPLDKFEKTDFKYYNIIFKSQPPKYPNKAFLVRNLRIFLLQLLKFECVDFKYNNSCLKFQPKYTPKKAFLVQILEFSFLHQSLELNKIEGADFKYDNSFFKFQFKISSLFFHETCFQNYIPFPCVYYLCSQRFLYLLKLKSNYKRIEIIFCSR